MEVQISKTLVLQALLRSAPLLGNQEELKKLEDVTPQTNPEKKAAELQVKAGSLYQEG